MEIIFNQTIASSSSSNTVSSISPSMNILLPLSRIIILFVCVLMSYVAFSQTVYYVKTSSDDTKDGKSWDNAFRTLQQALAIAGASGDQIWVAAGTYYPDEGNAATDNDRTSSFNLKDCWPCFQWLW